MNTEQKRDFRESLMAGFEVFKWIWAGIAAVIFGAGVVIYNLQIETVSLRKDLEAEQRTNSAQEKKIEETYKLMRDIAREQAKIAQSMQNLSDNVSNAVVRVAQDTAEIRARVDRHIEAGND